MKLKTTAVFAAMAAAGMLLSSAAMADAAVNDNVSKLEAMMNRGQDSVAKSTADFTNDWFNFVHVSAQANVDAFYGSRSDNFNNSASAANYTAHTSSNSFLGSSTSGVTINNADLFFDVTPTNWLGAHVSADYSNGKRDLTAPEISTASNRFAVDEAYVKMADFNRTPFYTMLGKQYLNFGVTTDRHPMLASLTQLLTQTDTPAVAVGFAVPQGAYGSLSTFTGARNAGNSVNTAAGNDSRFNSYVADLGYDFGLGNLGNYTADISYLSNMASTDYLQSVSSHGSGTAGNGYVRRKVGAADLALKGTWNAFSADAQYVRALSQFNQQDATWRGTGASTATTGAQPWAFALDAGYNFLTMGHDSSVTVGYQRSGQAEVNQTVTSAAANNGFLMALPQIRVLAQYDYSLVKSTDLQFQLARDDDYSTSNNGTGHSSYTGTARVAVKFA